MSAPYFLAMNYILFYFSGAGKFRFTHGLRQLTRDVKRDVRTLIFGSYVTFAPTCRTLNDVQKRVLRDVKCQK